MSRFLYARWHYNYFDSCVALYTERQKPLLNYKAQLGKTFAQEVGIVRSQNNIIYFNIVTAGGRHPRYDKPTTSLNNV